MPSIDFCRMIAEIITSPHDQEATLMIYARKGAGKSEAGIAIAERVSQIVAEIKGGTPEKYFSQENIAVITGQEVVRVMRQVSGKKYSCVGFDDIGIAWNARDFMDNLNQSLNDIEQTSRTQNWFKYFTLPDPMLIDKVPRDLINYIMEIESSHFEHGYIVAKIFAVKKDPRHSRIVRPYLLDFEGNRIVRHIIFRASPYLIVPYQERRRKIESQNTSNTIDSIERMVEGIQENRPLNLLQQKKIELKEKELLLKEKILEEKQKKNELSKQKLEVQISKQEKNTLRNQEIIKLKNEGATYKEISQKTGANEKTIFDVLSNVGLTKSKS